MPGERVTEDSQLRVGQAGIIRVSQTFNRGVANLVGTGTLAAVGTQILIIKDYLSLASFSLDATTVSDNLVYPVTPGVESTIVVEATNRLLKIEAINRSIGIPAAIRVFSV